MFSTTTGKANAIASINKWLQANVLTDPAFPWTYSFIFQAEPTSAPVVEVMEFQFFQPPADAWGDVVFPTNTGGPQQGKRSDLMMKFDIIRAVDEADYLLKARRLRDKIVHSLQAAGKADDQTGSQVLPPIELLDYVAGGSADTGITITVPLWESNHLMEFNIGPTAEQPKFYIYRLLVKFQWFELFN